MKVVSQFISFIFHPIFIVLYAYLIYFNTDTYTNRILYLFSPGFFKLFFLFLFSMAVFFPLTTIIIMKRTGWISSYHIPERKERLPVLVFTMIYYGMTYFIFRSWNQNLSFFIDPFISFLFGGLVLLGVLFIITTFWKISLHTASISGLAGGSMALLLLQKEAYNVDVMMGVNSLLLFSIGLVSFSRLKLNAHHYGQVLVGSSVGFIIMFMIVINQWYI